MSKLSPTATSLLTLLSNVNDLIVEASDRQRAKEVMKAIRIYARNKLFPIPQDKMDNFDAVLIDAKPFTLTSIIKDIAEDIVLLDKRN